jgi:hypothetical protein
MKNLIDFAAAALAILVPILTLGFPASAQEPTNPVGFALSCAIPAGQTTCTAQVSPPAGKRLVIETVSARVTVPSGQVGQLYVSMSVGNLPNGTIAARHYIVLTPATDTTYIANEAFRMYGSVGVSVSIQAQRIKYTSGAPGSLQYEVNFSGYLLP